MQVKSNKPALFAALSKFVKASNYIVANLRKEVIEAGFPTWEAAQPACLEWVGLHYGVALVVSQSPRNKGQQVLDSSAADYEAAKTALRRIRESLTGDADKAAVDAANPGAQSNRQEVEVPAEIAALAAKLVALCNEYEKSKKLAAQAVAEAFAAK